MQLHRKQAATPSRGTRRARNWRKLEFGQRIRDKHGVLTAWEAYGPPYLDLDRSWTFCVIDCQCVGCGEFHQVVLNDVISGNSRSCKRCRLGGRLGRGELVLERPYPWEDEEEVDEAV